MNATPRLEWHNGDYTTILDPDHSNHDNNLDRMGEMELSILRAYLDVNKRAVYRALARKEGWATR